MTEIRGLSGARGQALLPAAVLSRRDAAPPGAGRVDDPEAEVERFQTVQRGYAEELDALYEKTLAETGAEAADIIKAYAVIAQDDFFSKSLSGRSARGYQRRLRPWRWSGTRCARNSPPWRTPHMKARADDIRNGCDELIRRMNVSSDIRLNGTGR